MSNSTRLITALCCMLFAGFYQPAAGQVQWKVHDLNRPKPEVVTPPAQTLPVPPPPDAVVLFDGTDLSNWEATDGSPTQWVIEAGNMQSVAGAGYIQSKARFGDMHLHVEWAAPTPVQGSSQGRGNSGVFLMGIYEVQVLDSYNNPTYADGQAAAVYGQSPPLVNATRPPGEWQAYDIFWHRPRFGPAGNVEKPARVTVIHNGIMVQDNFELWGPTEWLQFRPYEAHPDRMPIRFQDHGNPVLFRNVWVRDLEPGDPYATETPEMDTAMLDRYVGRYHIRGNSYYTIGRSENDMYVVMPDGRTMAIEPASETRFPMTHTSGAFTFELDDEGNPTGLTWEMSGSTNKATRAD